MSVDMFLKIDGIKGEAQDHKHKDEIDVHAWKWGANNAATTHTGTGGGSGKVHVHNISLSKWVDLATPSLMLACCSGKHFPKAVLTVRKAGEKPLEYMVITMTDLLISVWSTGATDGQDRQAEHIDLNFAKFKLDYKTQNPDGSPGVANEMGWDIAGNANAA